jgi:zinc/manganese transport system substrate-binding protein
MMAIVRIIAAAGMLTLAGPAWAQLNVVTTTTDLAAIARAVGGPAVEVTSLTRGTRNPHFAEAKPSMIRKVHDADLLLLIGADLEIGWMPAVLPAARNPDIMPGTNGFLDLSTVVPLLDVPSGKVTRAMGDVHARGNPHYWLDPERGRTIARAVSARLALLDPTNRDGYQDRLKSFETTLDAKIPEWRGAMATLSGRPVIAYHTSFRYLSHAFGFTIVDQVEPLPGIAPTASHLASLVARIKSDGIGVLLVEPYYETQSSAYLAQETGIAAVITPPSVGALPGVETYFDLFDGIVAALKNAGAI